MERCSVPAARRKDPVNLYYSLALNIDPTQGDALDVFRASTTDTPWTFVSPAAVIYPGESEGSYRVGGDSFFTDANGESKISVTDYAKAMLDEAQSAAHLNQRISIAY